MVGGEEKTLLVHRKGSTRAFPPHHPLIPVDYQLTGQPVLIGGTMGTHSYVLTGLCPPPLAPANLLVTEVIPQSPPSPDMFGLGLQASPTGCPQAAGGCVFHWHRTQHHRAAL